MTSPSAPAPRIFVSHSHTDNAFCRRLVADLRAAGADVWYDEHNLGWGELRREIDRELPARPNFVVILSPDAVASDWVNREIDGALDLLSGGAVRVFLPVVARPCIIPATLRGFRRVDYTAAGEDAARVALFHALGLRVSGPTSPPTKMPPLAREITPVHSPVAAGKQLTPSTTLSRRSLLIGAGSLVTVGTGIGVAIKIVSAQGAHTSGLTHNTATVTPTPRLTPGALRWSYNSEGPVATTPVVANGRVYVGSFDYSLYALDANTGGKLWRFRASNVVRSSPVVANERVYVGSDDHSLYALDANTGGKLWSFQTGASVTCTPVVANGRVFFGSEDGFFYALDANTGGKLWSFQTGGLALSPAVVNGRVFFGLWDSSIYALDANTGGKLWSFQAGAATSAPAVANGLAYFGSMDGFIYVLDASTGTERRKFPTGGATSTPTLVNSFVYAGSANGFVYAFDATTGGVQWSYQARGPVYTSPVVANERVYVGSDDHSLYALDANTGGKLWSFPTGGILRSAPAVANGLAYFGSWDTSVYALKT